MSKQYFVLPEGQAVYEGKNFIHGGQPWFKREVIDQILTDQVIDPKTWRAGEGDTYLVECPGDEFPVVIKRGSNGLYMFNTWSFKELTEDDLAEQLAESSLATHEKSFLEDCLPNDTSIYTGHPWYQAACIWLIRGNQLTLDGIAIKSMSDLNKITEKIKLGE
jgi:hypothetical protein